MILQHVSCWGWDNSIYTEESLACKKAYPGFQFTSKSKKWLPRVKTVPESMTLLVRRLHSSHAALPAYLRKKLEASSMEALSERAAAVWHLGQELLMNVPINPQALASKWTEAWATGSQHVDVEVQVAVMDKSDTFSVVQSIPTFKQLIIEHTSATPSVALQSDATAIRIDEFNLLMRLLRYDEKVFENWVKKCQNVFGAREHAVQEFRASRHNTARAHAKKFLSGCCLFLTWQGVKAENIIGDILNFKRDKLKFLNVASQGACQLAIWNATAPSLMCAELQVQQCSVLAWALHDSMQSVGIVLMPVFTYNKGKLHLEETKMIDQLTKGNHNIDWQFCIQFTDQCDERDLRPMNYPGRFVFPTPLQDPKKSMWFHCNLRKEYRTKLIPQQTPKYMKEIEDLSDDALPGSCDNRDSYIHGAAKYNQIGVPAAEAVLSGCLEGPDYANMPATFVLDLFPRVGDFLEAFCKIHNTMKKTHMYYVAVSEDQTEMTWLEQTVADTLAMSYEESGKTPYGNLEAELKEELLEPVPKRPDMNKLVYGGANQDQLFVPIAICKEWQLDPQFGQEFSKWLDSFVVHHAILDSESTPGPTDTPKKRAVGETLDQPNSPAKKKPKLHTMLETTSIKESLLAEAKLAGCGKDPPLLQIRTGHTIYIVNNGTQEWVSPPHFNVTGFGKGSFKIVKDDASVGTGMIFNLASSEDLVVFNGAILTVGKVLNDQKASKPDASICYHSIKLDDTNPKIFTLKFVHRVVFFAIAPDGKNDNNISNMGQKESAKVWNSGCLQVLWAVRWAAKGLMPIKPMILLRDSVTLPPGRGLLCTGSEPGPEDH